MTAAPFPDPDAVADRLAAFGEADQSFLKLQGRISELENQIADRREFYNDTVTTFNTRIQQIPDSIVASWLSFTPATLFQVEESDREDVEIKFQMAG